MKFETNLNRQDKRTIAIVLYLAVVALFAWYLIRPAWTKLGTLDDQIETAQSEREANRTKIINLASAEALYDKAVTDITDSTSYFYDVMDNSEIEKMVTEYILDFGLTPVNLYVDITDGSYVEEQPYVYSGIQTGSVSAAVVAEDTSDTESESEAVSAVGTASSTVSTDVQSLLTVYTNAVSNCSSTSYSQVECHQVTVEILGNGDIEQKLIDDITKNPSIRVTGFSWSEAEPVYVYDEEGNPTVVNSGQKQLTINFNFYMSDKPDFETEDQASEEG